MDGWKGIVGMTEVAEAQLRGDRERGYCKELPVFGFNSSGYDLKLVKQYLMKELCTRGEEPSLLSRKLESILEFNTYQETSGPR